MLLGLCAALVVQKARGAAKVPHLAWRHGKCSIEVKFSAWGVAVEFDDEFDDEPKSIRDLIERLRKLGESLRPRDHLYAMAVDSELSDRLDGLSDRQIGQLLFEFCWAQCYVPSFELTIVTQAIDRLRRSAGGERTKEEAEDNPKQRPLCPKCGGNEMYLHYGIDEPDFWQCAYGSCGHKIYVGEH